MSPEEMAANHESWTDYEPRLRQRIEDQILDAATTWKEDFVGGPGKVVSVRDAAAVITWWVRDSFDFDRYEHPDWQPFTDADALAEFFTERGHPIRIRRSHDYFWPNYKPEENGVTVEALDGDSEGDDDGE